MNPLPPAIAALSALPAGGCALGALAAAAAAVPLAPLAPAAGAAAAPPAAPNMYKYIFNEARDAYLPFNKDFFAELASHLTQTSQPFVHCPRPEKRWCQYQLSRKRFDGATINFR